MSAEGSKLIGLAAAARGAERLRLPRMRCGPVVYIGGLYRCGEVRRLVERAGRQRVLAGISLLAVVVYWGAIFVATHVPALPSAAARMSDKVQHFGAYFLLAVLLIAAGRMLGYSRRKVYPAVLVIGAAYGMVDELTQLLVPNRTADPRDWAADMCGVAAACLVASLVEKLTVDARP